jgi:hypothetical protein
MADQVIKFHAAGDRVCAGCRADGSCTRLAEARAFLADAEQ